ncbi:hypothetical protein HG719_06625 [Methanobacterium subterraneum]|uniref:Uncharacterized protein n=1 Tax=Methanobacterium subterraneum TaxID=59277 RepID=A0A7K4DNQ0_9EURY|nr:hypothetical protein [Methanobacterium subterraneum]
MIDDTEWPCCCLNEHQNEQIDEIRNQIFQRYGIKLATSQIVGKAVQFYLDCHLKL